MPYSPRWYTLLHAGNAGDLDHYLELAAGAESILELGSGIGRISLPLVYAEKKVTALDNDPSMARALQEAIGRLPGHLQGNIEVATRDMRDFAFERRFDRVFIPYNGLLCLLSYDDVVRCLALVRDHLAPEGLLSFDIYDVPKPEDDDPIDDEISDDFEPVTRLVDGTLAAEVYEKSIVLADPMRFDTCYLYRVFTETGEFIEEFEYTIEQRCIYKEDLARLLGEAGLEIVSVTGDFEDAPVTDETLQVVITARRAG